jgi:hypothetical protein
MVVFKGSPGTVECQPCDGPIPCSPCSVRCCVNVGSMLAPSSRGFLATHLLTRGVLMRHEDASADPRTLVKGWIAQSVTLRWLTRNFRYPGTASIVMVHRLTGTVALRIH